MASDCQNPSWDLQIHLSIATPQSPYLLPHMPSRPYRTCANPISSRRLYDNANPQNSANAVDDTEARDVDASSSTLLSSCFRPHNTRGARRRFENGALVENTHTFGRFIFFFTYSKSSLTVYSRLSRLVMELEPADLVRWTRHTVCGQGWD